ncbi:hypothetical protein [Clostridium chromiireducens]|uniref:hypothetical protein n=1 Tax=Clostridium chromiireducens TaxID=225345 RepID=UPI0019248CB6|nr:hypothetical protein [Clostridium chromiireducens]
MLWEYILKIRLNNETVYIKDIDEKEFFTYENDEEFLSINNTNYETLANVEVLKHGRKR